MSQDAGNANRPWWKFWARNSMDIKIQDLFSLVGELQAPGVRIGWPDDPTVLSIVEPYSLAAALDSALRAFRGTGRPRTPYFINAKPNSYHLQTWIRFVQSRPSENRDGQVEPELEAPFAALHAQAERSRGKVSYWGGNNYFDLVIPYTGPMREAFLEAGHLSGDKQYAFLLERAAWDELREKVYRWSNLAETFARQCTSCGLATILVPSVGLCIDPWLFAEQGLSVIATEIADTALAALSTPERWPRLYSRNAWDQWDIETCASYATENPFRFTGMPDLLDQEVREGLRRRMAFLHADWGGIPLADDSVEAIFAINALPRRSPDELVRVLGEWVRVLKPGGSAFIAQHNFLDGFDEVKVFLREAGWVETNIFAQEPMSRPGASGFHLYHSSG